MGRSGYRATLENGHKLDINHLVRRGFIRPGAATGSVVIQWTNSYWGPVTGIITADMRGTERGWFNIKIGEQNQHVDLRALPRHFGGWQWFFLCPRLDRLCTVLWRPPGANYFACRQKWGRQVAYASQFLDRDNRAHRGKARLNSRLCRIGGLNPDEWEFPPKPKWMRWSTYRRAEDRFDRYEAMLDEGIVELIAKFERKGWLK
jgi:hypothetical protein